MLTEEEVENFDSHPFKVKDTIFIYDGDQKILSTKTASHAASLAKLLNKAYIKGAQDFKTMKNSFIGILINQMNDS